MSEATLLIASVAVARDDMTTHLRVGRRMLHVAFGLIAANALLVALVLWIDDTPGGKLVAALCAALVVHMIFAVRALLQIQALLRIGIRHADDLLWAAWQTQTTNHEKSTDNASAP